jgi:hypothetical protein
MPSIAARSANPLERQKLFLFHGNLGRFDYRENVVAFFEIHPLDGTGRDNRSDHSRRCSDDNFGHDLVRNNFLNRSSQSIPNTRAHR